MISDQPVVQLTQAVFAVLLTDHHVHVFRSGSLAAIVEYDQVLIRAAEQLLKAQKALWLFL